MCITEIHVTTFKDPFRSYRIISHTVSGSSMADAVAIANTRLVLPMVLVLTVAVVTTVVAVKRC